jgi:hypothetical protein
MTVAESQKSVHVVSSTMPKAPGKTGEHCRAYVTAPPRLGRNVSGQSKKGLGTPNHGR